MENKPEETLSDIHRMMARSSRFHSLSGFSLIAAGLCGLLGAGWISSIMGQPVWSADRSLVVYQEAVKPVVLAAFCTLLAALLLAFVFTALKERKMKVPIWNVLVRKVILHFAIPMVSGGIFVLGMLYAQEYRFIAPACLFFYGLALGNAGHYTLKEIRYMGMSELLLGVVCLFTDYDLLWLVLGFGLVNILGGLYIWYKYR